MKSLKSIREEMSKLYKKGTPPKLIEMPLKEFMVFINLLYNIGYCMKRDKSGNPVFEDVPIRINETIKDFVVTEDKNGISHD